MTVKELKQYLNDVDENAIVVLYDGYDEGDVFCTTASQVLKENYIAYCRGNTCVRESCPDKLFVLAGWGYYFESLNKKYNKDLYLISSGPEAENSKKAAASRI